MTGEITPETVIKSNTFIIWRGGSPKDFELKVDYRITSGGNSGINYRSVVVPDTVTPDEQVRHARLPVRYRRPEPLHRPELRGEGPPVSGGARAGHARHRHTEADRALHPGDNKELGAPVTAGWNASTSSPAATC